jgi:hypothetical protein
VSLLVLAGEIEDRLPRCYLLRILPAPAGPESVSLTSDANLHMEDLAVLRADSLDDPVVGMRLESRLADLLQPALVIDRGVLRVSITDGIHYPVDHEFTGGIEASVEIDGPDHGFERVRAKREQSSFVMPDLLPCVEQEIQEPHLHADPAKRRLVDYSRSRLRQHTFVGIAHRPEEVIADNQTENGIPEKLKPLIGDRASSGIGIRPVGQGNPEKPGVVEPNPKPLPEMGMNAACVTRAASPPNEVRKKPSKPSHSQILNPSPFVAFDNQCCVMTPETKGIAEYHVDRRFSRRPHHIVKIALRIGDLTIDRWMDFPVPQ